MACSYTWDRRICGPGIYRGECDIRIYPWKRVRVYHGCLCGNFDPVSDLKRPASIQHKAACGSRTHVICKRRSIVLVYIKYIQFAAIAAGSPRL